MALISLADCAQGGGRADGIDVLCGGRQDWAAASWYVSLWCWSCADAAAVGECVSEHGKAHCGQVLGECVLQRDGYYPMSILCIATGAALLFTFIIPTTRKLQCESCPLAHGPTR